MTITYQEKPGTRKTSISENGVDSATTVYQVFSTERLSGFESISGFPAIGDEWPGVDGLFLKSVSASENEKLADGTWIWDVELTYGPGVFDITSGSRSYPRNPLERPAVWSFDGEMVQEELLHDLDNKAFRNSAGDVFDPAPLFDIAHSLATVQKNLATFNMGIQQYWTNGVNHTSYQGIETGRLRIDRMSATQQRENGIDYWAATLLIHYNPSGWVPRRVLDQGTRYVDSNGLLVHFVDKDGTKTTEPLLLDGFGGPLYPPSDNLLPSQRTAKEPRWLYFRTCPYVNFQYLLG